MGPVDFEQEIALRSHMCSGQPNCAHSLKIGWYPDMVGTRSFIHDQKVSLELDNKAHNEKRLIFVCSVDNDWSATTYAESPLKPSGSFSFSDFC